MQVCENQGKCGFFEKHADFSSAIFPMLANIYCNGPLQSECIRKQHLEAKGCFPSDDIAPTGLRFSET